MPTLTTAQQTELAALAAKDFSNFTNADAIRYYEILHQAGFDYGTLALAVVIEGDPSHIDYSSYSSFSGQLANAYSSIVADKSSINFTVGGSNWLRMQHRLTQEDWNDRQTNPNQELSYIVVDGNHTVAFAEVGLPPEAFTAHVPVSQLIGVNESTGNALWAEVKTGDGYLELIKDSFLTVSSTTITNPLQSPLDIAQDIADKVSWSAGAFQAAVAVGTAALELELPRVSFPDFWSEFDALDDFFSAVYPSGDIPEITTSDVQAMEIKSTSSINLPNWYSFYQNWFGVSGAAWDPLAFDLNGSGLTGTSGTERYFDLDNDGFAELYAGLTSQDAFLAYDINDNGRIDNGGELFGDGDTDGFTALAAYDGNSDGVIDASDAIWSDLVLWRDANEDGFTQDGELLTLASQNITGIDVVNFVEEGVNTSGGGRLDYSGTAFTSTGTMDVGSYSFFAEAENTRYAQDYDFDVRAAFMPTLRGYNQMPDLHIALSLDNDETNADSLMAIMQGILAYDFVDVFANFDTIMSDMQDFIFRWAGVDTVSPTSRGDFVDAQKLEFIEAYLGARFVDRNFANDNPGAVQADEVHEVFDNLFFAIVGNVMAQTSAGALFDSGREYDFASDQVTGTYNGVNQINLDALEDYATNTLTTTQGRQDFWVNVAAFLRTAREAGTTGTTNDFGLSSADITAIEMAIENSDTTLTWLESGHDPLGTGVASIEYKYDNPLGDTITGTSSAETIDGTDFDDTIIGDAGADTITGGAGQDVIYGHNEDGSGDDNASDTIYGEDGDDTIYGGGGDDYLYGGTGNDHLVGGAGDDRLYDGYTDSNGIQNLLEGGSGNDYYRYVPGTSGNMEMYIVDSSGTDGLYFENPFKYFTPDHLNFTRYVSDHLRISGLQGSYSFNVIIDNQFVDLNDNTGQGIETIRLYSTTNPSTADVIYFDLKDYLLNFTGEMRTIGTSFDDTIYGIQIGSKNDDIDTYAGHDTVYSGEGDDEVWLGHGNDYADGGAGDDYLRGEEGNDELHGGEGHDDLVGNEGDDILDGGDGNDWLYGGDGNDKYIYSTGDDVISDGNGYNTLHMGFGLTPDDLNIYEDALSGYGSNPYHIWLSVSGAYAGNTVLFFQAYYNDPMISELTFDNGFKFDFTNWNRWVFESDNNPLSNETIDTSSSSYRIIFTTGGTDNVYVGAGNDYVATGSEDDFIYLNDGDDWAFGGADNDEIYGEAGNDNLWGHTGDDLLSGGPGDDMLDGGDGTDVADYSASATAVTVNLAAGIASGEGSDTLISIENIYGSAYADTLTGDSNDNVIKGGAGADIITGSTGNDDLEGGAGNDSYIYNSGDGIDTILDSDGADDKIIFGTGITLNDLGFNQESNDVRIVLNQGTDEILVKSHLDGTATNVIETLLFDDSSTYDFTNITFNNAPVAQDDGFDGVEDTDVTGNLLSDNGNGVDSDPDSDPLNVVSGTFSTMQGGSVTIFSNGDFTYTPATSFTGADSFDYTLQDGQGGEDTATTTINVASGINVINGTSSGETINGTIDADEIHAGAGDDIVYAGDGDDVLYGGAGEDDLYGEAGNDLFIYDDSPSPGTYYGENYYGGTGIDTIDLSGFGYGIALVNNGLQVKTNYDSDATDGSNSYLLVNGLVEIENVIGTDYADHIVGRSSVGNTITDNVLTGGLGDDRLFGQDGDDIYIYNVGDGHDEIIDSEGHDEIHFGAGISSGDLTFTKNGQDLEITFAGTSTDSITITDHYSYEPNHSPTSSLNTKDVETLVFADSSEFYISKTVNGTSADEIITGSLGNDLLYGNDGNDTIMGGDGYDRIEAGAGDDLYIFDKSHTSGDHDENVDGGAGVDTVDLSAYNYGVLVLLDNQASPVRTRYSSSFLDAGTIHDLVYELKDFENVVGTDYGDSIQGTDAGNIITGGGGDDRLFGQDGDDIYIYNVGDGHDEIIDSEGHDEIHFGAGISSGDLTFTKNGQDLEITFAGTLTDSITITDHYVFYESNPPTSTNNTKDVETLVFVDSSELDISKTVNGTSADETINGSLGNDILYGGDGNDTILGGDGYDWIDAGAGDDVYVFDKSHASGDHSENVDGGGGIDTVDVSAYDYGVWVNLNGTVDPIRTRYSSSFLDSGTIYDLASDLKNFENVIGTDYGDVLVGSNSADNIITGGMGDDKLIGSHGGDTYIFNSGDGSDIIIDNNGSTSSNNDAISFGSGIVIDDLSIVNTGSEDTTIVLNASVDEIFIDRQRSSNDQYHIEELRFNDGFETDLFADYGSWMWGTTGNDVSAGNGNDNVIIGDDGNDDIDAGAGDDDVHGGSGADDIHGDAGDDFLHGGAGDDTLYGDDGLDILWGGDGADTFVFDATTTYNDVDQIADFNSTEDAIDIADLLTAYDPMTDVLSDFVEITDNGTDSTLSVDADGGGDSFAAVASILGVTGLTDEAALQSSSALITS